MFGLRWNETQMRRFDQELAAGTFADYVVLTSDYQGPESFEKINEEVIKGLNLSEVSYKIIKDRKEAIEHILEISNSEDIIALLGMSYERYQKINGKDIYFSEEDIINNYLNLENES